MTAISSRLHGLLSDKDGPLPYLTGPIISRSLAVRCLWCIVLVLLILFPLYRYVSNDYRAYLSLGPGGTPATFSGYLRVTFLRVFFARSDPYVPPILDAHEFPANGYLHDLPYRLGHRPRVAGIAPHRQTTQKGTSQMQLALAMAITNLEAANADLLSTGISCFEHYNLGLFFSPRPGNNPYLSATTVVKSAAQPSPTSLRPLNPTCGQPAEITHLHTIDSSMHLTLHPSDAALVISHGWGERHPLAGRGPWVPKGFVMVYAPRGRDEIDVLMEIVKAGTWWVGGVELKGWKGEN
ncbi:MAG: hypothetical protein Q9187_005996 [Circinaria calcarea]